MNHPLYLVSTDSGNNNLAPSVIDAETDIDAMRTWLIARGTRSINTLDAYKREAVRFLTWLNKNQITMRGEQCAAIIGPCLGERFFGIQGNGGRHSQGPLDRGSCFIKQLGELHGCGELSAS